MLFFNASSISVSTPITEKSSRPRRATEVIFGKTILLNNMQIFCTQWLSKPLGGGRRRLLLLSVIIVQRRNVKLLTRTIQLIADTPQAHKSYADSIKCVADNIRHRKYH